MNGLLRSLAYCILGLPMTFVWTASHDILRGHFAAFMLFVVLFATDVFVSVLVHELGHAWAATLCGWRISCIAVFPLSYHPKTRRLRFWTGFSGDIGGAVVLAAAPIRSRSRVALFVAAGPAANLLFAAVLLLLVGALHDTSIQNAIASTAMVSLLLGIGNLLPFRTRGGLSSDGMKLSTVVMRGLSREAV